MRFLDADSCDGKINHNSKQEQEIAARRCDPWRHRFSSKFCTWLIYAAKMLHVMKTAAVMATAMLMPTNARLAVPTCNGPVPGLAATTIGL